MIPGGVSLGDRGLAFGDGLFETLFVHHGRPVALGDHLARLRFGLRRLGLPEPSGERVLSVLEEAIEPRRSGVCKLLVTAGEGPRGYRRPARPELTVAARFGPLPEPPVGALTVTVNPVPVLGTPVLRGVKHLNRLPQVLAQQALAPEATEALMCDGEGRVVSGTMSNLFWREGRRWLTPRLVNGMVAGTRRAGWIERLGAEAVPCGAGRLAAASEAFCCNAVSAWRPIASLLGRPLSVPDQPPAGRASLLLLQGFWQPDEGQPLEQTVWREALEGNAWARVARRELG